MPKQRKRIETVPDGIKKEIILPKEFVGESAFEIFDTNGQRWRIEEKKTPRFGGLLSRRVLAAVRQDTPFEESLDAALQRVASRAFSEWIEEDAGPALKTFPRIADPLFQKCIEEAERLFRKEFITKLGTHGEAMWKKILSEQLAEIERILQKYAESAGNEFSASGILPSSTRFRWQMKTSAHIYSIFCLENPPQRRTIAMFGKQRRLAFPWMCFLAVFQDEKFMRLHVFYRPASLQSEEDALFFPNLPNVMVDWPFLVCLGESVPPVRLQDPLWHDVLLGYFWDSGFGEQNRGAIAFWQDACGRIPEVATLDKWEELSNTDPEKMLTLPWKEHKESLGAFVEARFEGILKSQKKEGEFAEKRDEEKNRAIRALIQRFRERLEEELHFLGAHFAVSVETGAVTKEITAKRFQETSAALEESLKRYCSRAAQEASREWQERISARGAR